MSGYIDFIKGTLCPCSYVGSVVDEKNNYVCYYHCLCLEVHSQSCLNFTVPK